MRRLAALALLLLVPPARAERLPIRTYGAGEGLAGDLVRNIHQDSRGFLWLATNAGVSRFDGATFTNFGAADGVPFGSARKVVETPDGALYVLARERVVRFEPSPAAGGKAFAPLASPELARWVGEVLDLTVAPDGAVVLVGTKGAARLRGGTLRRVDLGPPSRTGADWEVAWATAFDAGDSLWVARRYEVIRIAPGGGRTTWPVPPPQVISSGWGWLPSMVADRRRGVWVQDLTELWHLTADPSGKPVREEVIDRSTGLPSMIPRALHETASGVLWIATPDQGLVRCEGAPGARRFTTIGTREGLPDNEVTALTSDAQENLWAGTGVAGLVRVAAEGMTSWGAADGLTPVTVQALYDDPEEGLLVIMADLHFNSMKGGRIVHRWTPAPPLAPNWGEKQLVARGRDGRLWLATGTGLAMYPPGTNVREFATRKPERLFDTGDGLPGNEIQRLFVASDGTVWFGILHAEKGLCRMDGQGGGLRCFDVSDGLPPEAAAVAFEEDRGGGIWFGLWDGGLFRHREGRIESWPETSASVQTGVSSIQRDASGGLWVAGGPGLLRVEDAASPHPRFRRLTGEQGIFPETTATAEDLAGRLYVGSAHGVARVDLGTGVTRRFTVADGLPSNRVTAMQWDADGALWIGTSRGVARLIPRARAPRVPPRVFLTGVTVAGTRRDPQAPLTLEADERSIEFAFTSPSFRAAETMRFQWRLLDTSDAWSPPGTSRSVVFAGLSPGRHRFEVRAVDGEGQVSSPVATEFSIRPPLWLRGWFLGLVALTLAGTIAAVHRARVRRLLEVERVRTRIATDLHDDVGASLSQIAVLSQVARRQAARGAAEAGSSLERITDLSGGVVDSMSDVVWSINPARDRMSDLVHRMRRFAVDLFADGETAITLDLPEDADDARLDPDVRRQIYLVFKEALRNVARHAEATHVDARLHREVGALVLTVRDNGKGLGGPPGKGTGFGLQNMRRRAEAVGGKLTVAPGPGGGTEIVLRTGPVRELSKRMGAWLRRAP